MLYTIQNEFLTVSVDELGAQLWSILGADGTEYLWQGDSNYWSDRALNIFPYVARLTQGSYYLDSTLHHMDIHGIAPYRSFALISRSATAMTFELCSDAGTLAAYPREFAFRIRYALDGAVLNVTYEVENRDGKTMYFGLGGHPGFNVPLVPGKSFDDYRLRFAPDCHPQRVGFTEDCFVSGQDTPFPLEGGNTISLGHELFDDDAIVLKGMSHQVTIETGGDSHSVTVTFPQMDYLGLWHMPKTDAPYVCIEPWCSLPSRKDVVAVFEKQEDLLSLAPGGLYRNDWSIRIG